MAKTFFKLQPKGIQPARLVKATSKSETVRTQIEFLEGKKSVGLDVTIPAGTVTNVRVQFPETPTRFLGFSFSNNAGFPPDAIVSVKIKTVTIISTVNINFYDRIFLASDEFFRYEYPLNPDDTINFELQSAAGGKCSFFVVYI